MVSLTVGYVSGVIAAGVFVLQFLIPNALIVILVGFLKNEHTAVTWSVVERNLLSSLWPTFLQSESTATRGVDRSIRLITWLRPLGLGLVTVAAIVTPLGLYDNIAPSSKPQSVPMTYVSDSGPMGFGTPARSPEGFSRKCGDFTPLQCPGTTVVIDYDFIVEDNQTYVTNGTVVNDDYDVRIPKVLAELYQSGLSQQQKSVSSFFDIQTRQYGYNEQTGRNNISKYVVEGFQYLSNILLNDAIEPFEGLVVDTVSGAIGFRNHTAPVEVGVGAEWFEDLLFIEPETACVNLNLSLEFKLPYGSISNYDLINISLVDEGGMANLVPQYPQLDLSRSQRDPQLQNRAYKAAWMTITYAMLTMNLTRPSPDAFAYMKSKVGARYPVTTGQTVGVSVNGIYTTNLFSNLLEPDAYISNYSLAEAPGSNYSNPFHISFENYTDVGLICGGAGGQDLTNMTNIHVECGLVFGAAHRKDGVETLISEPGVVYRQPIYTCATTSKASIKTVHFRYNTTQDAGNTLKGLSVLDVTLKTYSDNTSMPIWGVETVDFALHDLQQLWGLISPEKEHSVNLSTIRAPHLYLPGWGGTLSTSILSYQNIPGNTGPSKILTGLYQDTTSTSSGLTDYSGSSNIAMLAKWREYSRNEVTMAKALNLIWTDLAANMLCGTRNWNTKSLLPPNLLQKRDEGSASSDEQTLVPVTVFRHQIQYRWYFAIPAFASLGLVVLVTVAAFFMMVFGGGSPSRIEHYLMHLSSGRLLGAMQYPGECDNEAPTKEWITRVGRKRSDLSRHAAALGSGVSPFFAQPKGDEVGSSGSNGDKLPSVTGDYDTQPAPPTRADSGRKGYIQVDDQTIDE